MATNGEPDVGKRDIPKMKSLPSLQPPKFPCLIQKHKREGSTGTTGDESYTTDEDELDDLECNLKKSYEHVNIGSNGIFAYEDEFPANESFRSKNLCDDIPFHMDFVNVESNCDILKKPCSVIQNVNTLQIEENASVIDESVVKRKPKTSDKPASITTENSIDSNNEVEDKDKISWESLSSESEKDFTEIGSKEEMFNRLQEDLKAAQKELKLRDEEVTRLSRIRKDVETELEDLTASLFQEAHTMVREANVNQAAAEKSLKESEMKVDVLTAEVAALKTLVLTSTPSCPNPHLHPQISQKGIKDEISTAFTKKHFRSPSHFNLKYGREASPPESPTKERASSSLANDTIETKEGFEVDPNINRDFLVWKQNPKMDKNDPFIAKVYSEDISLCLQFNNEQLSQQVQTAIDSGNIFIEAVGDKTKTLFPRKCALLEVPRLCNYRMKLGDQDTWYNISQICRNRITAVCDFLNYLRYIERGLVKSSAHDVYWEMTRLRKEMVLARLGLPISS